MTITRTHNFEIGKEKKEKFDQGDETKCVDVVGWVVRPISIWESFNQRGNNIVRNTEPIE